MIIASLATIVFQLLRDELLYGDGIPIGLVGAGINFTRLSYFWSPELLGSLKSLFKGPRKHRKVQLGLFLVLAGVLALFAGPACAVLLLPRQDDWPAGGTRIYFNATKADMWPTTLTSNPLLQDFCNKSSGVQSGFCPSGGFQSIWSHYSRLDPTNFKDVVPSYASDLSGNRYYWPIESTAPVAGNVICLGDPLRKFMLQPHLTIVVALEQLMSEWWPTLLQKNKWRARNIKDRQAITSNVWTPNVQVNCLPSKPTSSRPDILTFPTFGTDTPAKEVANIEIPSQASDHLAFTWTPLPGFDDVTVGAVLQSPWSSDNTSTQSIACSVRAQWSPAHLRTEAFTFWQGWYPKNITFNHSYPKKGALLLDKSGMSSRNALSVEDAWLQTLTPKTPPEGPAYFDWGPTTIESILSSINLFEAEHIGNVSHIKAWDAQKDENKYDMLVSIIESVFVDGLSRYNIETMYSKQGDPSQWSFAGYQRKKDFGLRLLRNHDALEDLSQHSGNYIDVDFAVSGLNYQSSLAQQLAMVVLFLHVVVALLHTAWTVGRGRSSGCWDTLTEIVILAHNSKPTDSLHNSGAGVKQTRTFAKKISIRPTGLGGSTDSCDRLELLVEEEEISGDIELRCPVSKAGSEAKSGTFRPRKISNVSQISQSQTWPVYTQHDRRPPEDDSADAISLPRTPLLPLPAHLAREAMIVRIKPDVAYG